MSDLDRCATCMRPTRSCHCDYDDLEQAAVDWLKKWESMEDAVVPKPDNLIRALLDTVRFYRRTRVDPQPKGRAMSVFLAGGEYGYGRYRRPVVAILFFCAVAVVAAVLKLVGVIP